MLHGGDVDYEGMRYEKIWAKSVGVFGVGYSSEKRSREFFCKVLHILVASFGSAYGLQLALLQKYNIHIYP